MVLSFSLSSFSIRKETTLIFLALACFAELAGGARWQRLGPDGVGFAFDLVIDPTDTSILYLAAGVGVYKSVDRGHSWNLAARDLPAFSLAIDPTTPGTLYAATDSEVFKSTDGGASWFPANCGLQGVRLGNLSLDARNPLRLYAATNLGVYRTSNGGLSWSAVNNDLTNLDVSGVAAAPTQAELVYAATFGDGVFRSADGGSSWQPVNSNLEDLRATLLKVSPNDEQVLLVGTSTGLFQSSNGGNSWQRAGSPFSAGIPFSLAFDPATSSVVYAGTAINGIFKSLDGGLEWSAVNGGITLGGNANFGITALSVDPGDSSRVFAVTLDGGPGVFFSDNAGASWSGSGEGLDAHRVLDIVFDPTDSQTLYVIVDDRNGVYKSSDGGQTWQRMTSGFRDEFGLFDNLPLSLSIDPRNRNALYLGSNGDGLFRSSNGAASWQRVESPLFKNRFLTKVVVDPTNSSVVYVATSDGGVVKSLNSAASFAPTGPEISGIVTDIDVDPAQNSRLYAIVGTPDGLFRSLNGGGAWSRSASGLEGARPLQLLIDPSDPAILYLATQANGVFKSDNRGETWRVVNDGLGELAIRSLAASSGVIYAGTQHRGAYRSRDGGQTWSRAAEGLASEFIFTLAVDPDDPETVYAGLDAQSLYKRVVQPDYLYAAGRLGSRPQFDGLAFSNYSLEAAVVELGQIQALAAAGSLRGKDGMPEAAPTASTVEFILPPGQQVARTRGEFFPGSSSEAAWLEQLSDVSDVASFFQFGSADLSQLDGGVAVSKPLSRFLFTRVFEGDSAFRGQSATTRLSIFNPNVTPSSVQLSYMPQESPPGPPARQITREIPARSFLEGSFRQLFSTDAKGGYLLGEVISGGGVVGFEVIFLTERQTILGLNAAELDRPGQSYSAQLASQPGLFTNVNLINSSAAQRVVMLSAIREDGTPLGQTQRQILGPGEQLSIDASSLFGNDGNPSSALGDTQVASLVAEADGDGVAGDVIFGDPDQFRFAAALPLQTRAFTEAVFSQVANTSGFFTGLAFFYPGSPFQSACAAPANITIEVTSGDGTQVGMAMLQLLAGQRLSQLVPELVPESAGQAGGFIQIRSDQPVIAQMLFGRLDSQGIALFSAVPPTVVSQ